MQPGSFDPVLAWTVCSMHVLPCVQNSSCFTDSALLIVPFCPLVMRAILNGSTALHAFHGTCYMLREAVQCLAGNTCPGGKHIVSKIAKVAPLLPILSLCHRQAQ